MKQKTVANTKKNIKNISNKNILSIHSIPHNRNNKCQIQIITKNTITYRKPIIYNNIINNNKTDSRLNIKNKLCFISNTS